MDDIQARYNQLLKQYEVLRKENEELKVLLCTHGIEYLPKQKNGEGKEPIYSPIAFPPFKLSLDERVALFQSLFQGREDVFARR